MTEFLTTETGRVIAYNRIEGKGPGIVFLGGFRSDMQGTKAMDLELFARETGRAFLRFDYSGHGESEGRFVDGAIGDWFEDAREAITQLTDGPQVLVGSSMGGWISLLIAREMPELFAGLVTIAAAPDFTKNGFWAGFDDAQRAELEEAGQVALPSEYGDDLIITKRLIEDGHNHLVLETPLELPMPVRFLQGTADEDVPLDWAMRLLDHASGDDLRLTLVKGADHRFSTPECLTLVRHAVGDVLG